MASSTATRQPAKRQRSGGPRKHAHNEGIIPLLARAVREVEASAQRGKASPQNRTKFQVIALLMREERARVKTTEGVSDSERAETLKRLDGVASILAKTAARDTTPHHPPRARRDDHRSDPPAQAQDACARQASTCPRKRRRHRPDEDAVVPPELAERQVEPARIHTRMLANPFLAPALDAPKQPTPVVRLANWELLNPLLKSFEQGGGGAACMDLPEAPVPDRLAPSWPRAHAAPVTLPRVACATATAASCSPTSRASARPRSRCSQPRSPNAYPMLVVVPNVVKMNWAREVERWTPQRRVDRDHGDGENIDAFADVFVINYDILDSHLSWISRYRLQEHGRRRGAHDQEHAVAAFAQRTRARREHPRAHARRAAAARRAHRYAAHQRHRRLPCDLALPRLDRRGQARPRAAWRSSRTTA